MKTIFDKKTGRLIQKPSDILKKHDIVMLSPVPDPTYGMPIGDGDTGSLVWTNETSVIININKTDLFDDSTSGMTNCSNITENLTSLRHAGMLTIDFGAPVFEILYQKEYEHRLSLTDAQSKLRSVTPFSDISLNVFGSNEYKTTVISCEASYEDGLSPLVKLERWGSRNMWRWYSNVRRTPETGLAGTDASVKENRMYITQKLSTQAFCVAVAVVSDDTHGIKRVHGRQAAASFDNAQKQNFTLYLTVEAAPDIESAKIAADKNLDKSLAASQMELYLRHAESWKNFWNTSSVALQNDFVENLWYMNLYIAFSECRGKYPPHFCNGIWGFYHDFVPWNCYFHYNMQLHNFPLDAAGHGSLIKNYFELKRGALPEAKRFCLEQKGVEGALYCDVTDRNGKNDESGIYLLTCGPQEAMEMYKHYRYTGDKDFRDNYAIPLMTATAQLYENLIEKDVDGVYHIKNTQAYEGTPLFDDAITDLATIRSLFSALASLLPEKADYYMNIVDNLAGYTYLPFEDGELDGETLRFGLGAGLEKTGDCILSVGFLSETGEPTRRNFGDPLHPAYYGFPDTEISPVFPAGVAGIADRGTKIYDALKNQIRIHPDTKPPEFIDKNDITGMGGLCMGWCLMPIYLARMGMKTELSRQLEESAGTWTFYPQGFGSYGSYNGFKGDTTLRWKLNTPTDDDTGEKLIMPAWNFRHFDYEPLPILSAAVNEMLLQSYEGIIRFFPATDDACSFELYAEGGFRVCAEQSPGCFIAGIESLRGEQCRIILPEASKKPRFYVDGVEIMPEKFAHGLDTAYVLLIKKGSRAVICEGDISLYETTAPSAPDKNNAPKFCGESTLGAPRMF